MLETIDLFSGAGGLALGFQQSGHFEPVFAVEKDEAAARTFARNFNCKVLASPIEEVDQFPAADVILGGPPCQGFSLLGRDRDDDSRAEMNNLWRHYIRAVQSVQPRAFVMENVPEFQKSDHFALMLNVLDNELQSYAYSYGILNAADYGVAQNRKRGFLVAVRGVSDVPWPPRPTHDTPVTLREVIGDLSPYPEGIEIRVVDGLQDLHVTRRPTAMSLERYRAIPEGGNRFDLARNRPDLLPKCWANKKTGTYDVMGRLWWDRPSLTIRTEFFKPEKGRYLHPEYDRPITHREAARIQSFPDDFYFEGSKIDVAKQIGNAVPPLLAQALARHVYELLEK